MYKLLGTVLLLSAYTAQADFFEDLKEKRVESESKVTWKQYGPGNAGFANLLRYHPTLPGVCFTSPDMGNTYQTDDNGKSWYTVKDVDGQSDFSRINDIQYSTKEASVGYAIESSRLSKTTDTGHSWQNILNCPWYKTDSTGIETRSWHKKVSALGIDPQDENILFVGGGAHPRGQQHLGWNSLTKANAENPRGIANDYSGKIWRTLDSGSSWIESTAGIDAGAQFSRIIVHPKFQKLVFAASTHGLYRSWNKGESWVNVGEGQLDNNTIMDMDAYYDSKSGKFILYVIDQVRYFPDLVNQTTTNSGGIFKSEDLGVTWTNINKAGESEGLYLDINRLTGGVPYNYRKYVAKWFGVEAKDIGQLYPKYPTNALQYFNSINVDPSDPDTVYVGFYDAQTQYSIMPGRLWQTRDSGVTWTNIARNYTIPWEKDKDYWVERGNPYNDNMEEGHKIADVQFNDDYGQRSSRHFTVNSRGDIMLLYAHNTFLSTDKGVTWEQVNEDYTAAGNIIGRGDSNHPGTSIYQDRRLGEGVMYLGSGEHNLWRSAADGPDGEPSVTFFENSEETVFAVSTHPWDEKTVFTTSMRQHNMDKIMRSTDAGETWDVWGQATDGVWYYRTNDLTIDPANPDYMYFGVSRREQADSEREGGFHISTDGGKTFVQRNSGLPELPWIVEIELDPRDNSHASLFAAAQYNPNQSIKGGLFFTNNRGELWTPVAIPAEIEGVNSVTFDHTGRLYITAGRRGGKFENGGAWYSDDYGLTWTKVFSGEFGFKFDVSPFDHNLLICTLDSLAQNPGFYISEDRGLTWSKNNKQIGQPDKITEIQFDINEPQRINMTVLGSGFLKGTYPNGAAARQVAFVSSTASVELGKSFQTTVTVINGNKLDTLTYRSTNPDVVTVTADGLIEGVKRGAAKIIVTTADGRYADFLPVVVTEEPVVVEQNGFAGVPTAVPGIIEAENFDSGGQDISYYDSTVGNSGNVYRNNDVDLAVAQGENGGYSIANTIDGEWVEYTIDVPYTSFFNFELRTASGGTKVSAISIEENDTQLAEVTLPKSGWNVYATTVVESIELSKGIHTLRFNIIGGALKLNYFNIVESPDAERYTVTFVPGPNATIASGDAEQSVLAGRSAVEPTLELNTGYVFKGWDVAFDDITSDLTVTADVKLKWYKVTFDAGEFGDITDGLDVKYVQHGKPAVTPTITANEEYDFVGWDVDLSEITAVTKATAVYALKSFTVTFVPGPNGTIKSGDAVQSVEYGSGAVAPVIKPNEGYAFRSWDIAFDNVTSDLVITATITHKWYKVTFDIGEHAVTEDKTVMHIEHGSAAREPALTVSEAYDFIGWDVDFSEITKSIVVTAEYKIKTFTVTFKTWASATITSDNAVQTITYGSAAAEPTLSLKEGYEFVQWSVAFDNVTENLTVQAQTRLKQYTVRFNPGENGTITGGNAVQYIKHGSAAVAPVITPAVSHNFTGWDVAFDVIKGHTTVTARYAIKTFSVTFVAGNKGSITGGDASQTIDYGSAAVSPVVTPVIEEYEFAGWDIAINNITSNLTATAVYINNGAPKFTVVFVAANGGKIVAGDKSQHVNYAEAAVAPTVEPKEGYNFDGWDVAFDNVVTKLRVNAKFSKKTFTVTFDAGEYGTITSDNAVQTVTFGENAVKPTIEVDNEYINHTGWEGNFYYVRGDIVVTAKYLVKYPTVNYPLAAGINVATITTLPEDALLTSVLEPIVESLDFVEDEDGKRFFFDGSEWVNEIGELSIGHTYLISMNDDSLLPVTGLPVDELAEINLFEGNNVFAYSGEYNIDPNLFFADIMDRLEYVTNDQGKCFIQLDNGRWISSFGDVRPGEAYVITMKEDAVLKMK